MDTDSKNQSESDSALSCFTLDGVVAEMVIEVDEDSEMPQKVLKLEDEDQEPSKIKDTSVPASTDIAAESAHESSTSNTMSENCISESENSKLHQNTDLPNEDANESKEDCHTDKDYSATDKENSAIVEDDSLKEEKKEEGLKKSLISELDQIRKAAKLIEESKDELLKVAQKITENKEDLAESPKVDKQDKRVGRRKKSVGKDKNVFSPKTPKPKVKSPVEEDLTNFMPTAVSTRSKRDVFKNLKPKMFNLLGEVPKLEKLENFKKTLDESDLKFQRQLYRVLFDKWAPPDVNKMKGEILQFSGFKFNRNSEESERRKFILHKIPEASLLKICTMLDISARKKDNMITTILKFLFKPNKTVISIIDPDETYMQPFVKLERLSFTDKVLINPPAKLIKNLVNKDTSTLIEKSKSPKVETPKVEISKAVVENDTPEKGIRTYLSKKKKDVLAATPKNSTVLSSKKRPEPQTSSSSSKRKLSPDRLDTVSKKKSSVPETKIVKTNVTKSPVKEDTVPDKKIPFAKKAAVSDKSPKATVKDKDSQIKDAESSLKKSSKKEQVESEKPVSQESVGTESSSKSLKRKAMKNKIKKLKNKISKLKEEQQSKISKSKVKKKSEVENEDSETVLSLEADLLSKKEKKIEDTSSEVTLSADETAEETKTEVVKKKKFIRKGKPLRSFSNIRDKISNGSLNSLQRLHILLFGASDKAENLKANILAFGGFPFLEGSDEWRQKEFLLSLLALSTLKEYMNLLCMEYTGEDQQQTLINKLMSFLAAPSDPNDKQPFNIIPEVIENNILEMETKVVHSELVKPIIQPTKAKSVLKKAEKKTEKVKKPANPNNKGKGRSNRKVLMDEAQVRRLEADIAREQRILEREKRLNDALYTQNLVGQTSATPLNKTIIIQHQTLPKIPKIPLIPTYKTTSMKTPPATKAATPPVVKQTDAEQLNALLQTVYKRRALKAAGAIISTPNKGQKTKLGELPNVKFLVVTANYSDLDVLHHLIYMTDAVKAKVRKNILDFSGFGFNEDSSLYKDRIDFLNSLGYDISKRIAFLLGLCPFKTDIDKQDLNELIMYFLMSPCKTKQVPITHLPSTFFSKNMPEELCMLLQKHSDIEISSVSDLSGPSTAEKSDKQTEFVIQEFPESSTTSPPPTTEDNSKPKAKKSFKSSCLPPAKKVALSPSISTIPFKSAKPVQKSTPDIFPSFSTSPASQSLQKAIMQAAPLSQSNSQPQEYLVQQQTPDGKQKTYKLIKLPSNHPLSSVLKPQATSPQAPPPILHTQPLSANSPLATLPPGIIIFKNKTDPSLTNVTPTISHTLPTVPVILGQPQTNVPFILPKPAPSTPSVAEEEFVVPEKDNSKLEAESGLYDIEDDDDDIEILSPSQNEPPSDEELYFCIKDIIHNANFENITLRNVIDRVSSQYSDFDLTARHNFMKECVKKIIIGD